MTHPRPTAADRTNAFDLQPLERRLLMAAAPASPRSDALGSLFDRGERTLLVDRLTGLTDGQQSSLKSKVGSAGSFDAALQSIMRNRPPTFYFDESDVDDYADWITANLGSSFEVGQANPIVDAHQFSDGTGTKRVDLPNAIDWTDPDPAGTDDPDFPNILNRHEFWVDLARAARFTDDPKYANELRYELASFSQQFYTLDVPADWSDEDKAGWSFTSAIRAENWVETYFTTLGGANWTATDQSLLLSKIVQQGDYLFALAGQTDDYESNRTLILGKNLLMIAQAFPEIDAAGAWETAGRNLLFASMDAQLYPDGSHVEQSPVYTASVVSSLLEARHLDALNGDAWPAERAGRLANAVDAYLQVLTPDGRQPAIGDTYRTRASSIFLKAQLTLGETRWPASRPRSNDAWLFGPDAVAPFLTRQTFAPLGPRGSAFALPDGGTYVLRDTDTGERQLTIDAGPKGGVHGHHDLLGFELTGREGRVLIADPGAYKYIDSPDRDYVVSTRAHNTLNVDGENTAELEGAGNPGIAVNQWKVTDGDGDGAPDEAQFSATHRAYAHLPGAPIVTRGVWYDLRGTAIIVDFAESTEPHEYQQSFNLSADPAADVRSPEADGSFRTRHANGDNVRVAPLLGGEVERGSQAFVTNQPEGDFKDPSWRFRVTKQNVRDAVFATLVHVYDSDEGGGPTDVTAQVLTSNPSPDKPLTVRVTYADGRTKDVTFNPPKLDRLAGDATSAGGINDVEYGPDDRLHLVYQDRQANGLKYAVRGAGGAWSPAQSIDAGQFLGEYLDLKLDNAGRPAVAYFDGFAGDLKYAHLSHVTDAWEVERIDTKGSVGLYPSLAFSRNGTGGAAISYYDRKIGALKLAEFQGDRWDISVVASEGGDVGRFSQLMLDPNRPDSSKWAIGFEDTRRGRYLYTIQQRDGWRTEMVDDVMTAAGGYLSMAFYDTGVTDGSEARYQPAASYYDVSGAVGTALKFSYNDGTAWRSEYVDTGRRRGLYSRLFFDGAGPSARANIFYYDRQNNLARNAVRPLDGAWDYGVLDDGGREIHVARDGDGRTAYTNLDEQRGRLGVTFL